MQTKAKGAAGKPRGGTRESRPLLATRSGREFTLNTDRGIGIFFRKMLSFGSLRVISKCRHFRSAMTPRLRRLPGKTFFAGLAKRHRLADGPPRKVETGLPQSDRNRKGSFCKP